MIKLILLLYLIFINLAGFILMKADKKRARQHAWRIQEKTFFLVALPGGSIGCILGMYLFHHKTRHWYFVLGMPAILILQILIPCLIHFQLGWF